MTAKLESESKLLSSARDALSLEPMERDVLGPMQSEIADLREVSVVNGFAFGKDMTSQAKPCEVRCGAVGWGGFNVNRIMYSMVEM